MDTLSVDQSTKADEDAIWAIFNGRPGALNPEWKLHPGSQLLVVRASDRTVVAFAILRCQFDEREYVVDNLECERENGHATVRGVRALKVFGAWLESFVAAHGGGTVISCVGADNRTHEQALRKVGYVERVHLWTKAVPAAGGMK